MDSNADIQWLLDLEQEPPRWRTDGLVAVAGYDRAGKPPEEVAMVEKAREYGADAVFFEARRYGHPAIAQAFIFSSADALDDPAFARLHKRLWSWGGVPLVYRSSKGLVQLFRCAHQPDFIENGQVVCRPYDTLRIAGSISHAVAKAPWWDALRLRNGTIWDEKRASEKLLSSKLAAHKQLFDAVRNLYDELNSKRLLPKELRRKLLILSLLIRYLEDRDVLRADDFSRFKKGARSFFEVLADGHALVSLFSNLEDRFNGNLFALSEMEQEAIQQNTQLDRFARFVEGREEPDGQRHLWELYSFEDLPVELISHIYQLFVEDAAGSVYTPTSLVRLMLDEALSWERLDRLHAQNEVVLDPSCGSGIFLVEAYKRLVLHWRSNNDWAVPTLSQLKKLLLKVHGVDLEKGAVELAAFSLCLALCDALKLNTLREGRKLFPKLIETTLRHDCFFEARSAGRLPPRIGVVVGNPPFKSKLTTAGAIRSYNRYCEGHGTLPDFQLAYLFLHEAMEAIAPGGVLSMLQQYGFLYNENTRGVRGSFFARWDVREVLDFVSVRGLFFKDTKVIVIVATAEQPEPERKLLHATFRRTSQVEANRGFDIDYYDFHWVPRSLAITNDRVWRSNLVGGGRALGFVNRLASLPTLADQAESHGWVYGEGYVEGGRGVSKPADHIIGKPLLPSTALSSEGIDAKAIVRAPKKPIEGPRSKELFSPPMLLIREHMDLPHAVWEKGYLVYKNPIVGFAAPRRSSDKLKAIAKWIEKSKKPLQAYCAATSTRLFTRKATAVSSRDVQSLPCTPESGLDLSENEQVVVDDIVDYYRDFIRHGEGSASMSPTSPATLNSFAKVFCSQINSIYRESPLSPLESRCWSGIVCLPFVFGLGDVDWAGSEGLDERIDALLQSPSRDSINITRIVRIYDGKFVFFFKPDRKRFWLRSIALRDADETMSDLRRQGY